MRLHPLVFHVNANVSFDASYYQTRDGGAGISGCDWHLLTIFSRMCNLRVFCMFLREGGDSLVSVLGANRFKSCLIICECEYNLGSFKMKLCQIS